jgi:hypothetical protein
MKAIALKTLVLTVGLITPLFLLPVTSSADRGGSRDGGSRGHSGSHGSYGGSSHRGGYSSHYSGSRYSHSGYYSRYPSYSYSRSRSYYSRPNVSISIGTGYYGGYYSGYYSTLPFGYSSCMVGGLTYYSHGGRYYRPYRTGYVVVADPYIVERRPTTVVRTSSSVSSRTVSSKYDSYPRIWVSGDEYLIDEGDIFKITSSGLVWAELPLGSVASSLPSHASSVWYKDVEYFEAGGIYFQRVPEGYRLILPPWDGEF